jgi:hypothetical protein
VIESGVLLERLEISGVGDFCDIEVSLVDEVGEPRRWVVFYGQGGTGKSTLAAVMEGTRPGRCVPLGKTSEDEPCFAMAKWRLGAEDPLRPHGLRVMSPNAPRSGDGAALLRKEQALYERKAVTGGGFVFVHLPADRLYARGAWALSDPLRTVLRYDVRAAMSADASRLDLSRSVKQVLAYASISSALVGDRKGGDEGDPRRLQAAIEHALEHVLGPTEFQFSGLNARSFEPTFIAPTGRRVVFDRLPSFVKDLLAMVVLPVRALWASLPSVDPREAEGVIVIDDPERRLPPRVCEQLSTILPRALPGVQWVLLTASPSIAASSPGGAVFALRRTGDSEAVQLFSDELALTH